MQQWYQCPNCSTQVVFGARFCGNCGTPLNWQQQTLPPASYDQSWLYDESYVFWMSLGNTKTAYTGYNCLWCISETVEFIKVVAPRDLILATLQKGAEICQYRFPGAEVGLAFIQHVDDDRDNSFLVPMLYNSNEQTIPEDTLFKEMADVLFREIIEAKDDGDMVVKRIKKSKKHSNLWNEYIKNKKQRMPSFVTMPKQPLQRATNWRHIKPSEGDYSGEMPLFWYTYPGTEFKLDFWLKYKMEWQALFHGSKGR